MGSFTVYTRLIQKIMFKNSVTFSKSPKSDKMLYFLIFNFNKFYTSGTTGGAPK